MGNSISTTLGWSDGPEEAPEQSTQASRRSYHDYNPQSLEWSPTEQDVAAMRAMLSRYVPVELADIILDLAMYWPCITASRDETVRVEAQFQTENNVACYYVISPPILSPRIRQVKFSMKSCDQGWGGEPGTRGTYKSAWSWFEACVIRDQDPELVSRLYNLGVRAASEIYQESDGKRWFVQRNVVAAHTKKTHEVLWTDAGDHDEATELEADSNGRGTGRGFIAALKPGDRIAIIARAQYPGWVNEVASAEVKIFYAV